MVSRRWKLNAVYSIEIRIIDTNSVVFYIDKAYIRLRSRRPRTRYGCTGDVWPKKITAATCNHRPCLSRNKTMSLLLFSCFFPVFITVSIFIFRLADKKPACGAPATTTTTSIFGELWRRRRLFPRPTPTLPALYHTSHPYYSIALTVRVQIYIDYT